MMMEQTIRVDNQFLGTVAGGFGGQAHKYDLRHFVYRTVCNLPIGTSLQMQKTPNGMAMKEKYQNGDKIFVNADLWADGCYLAWKNGVYGFVDALYVR